MRLPWVDPPAALLLLVGRQPLCNPRLVSLNPACDQSTASLNANTFAILEPTGARVLHSIVMRVVAELGQHRTQRQMLRNFSFQGRQLNSVETWCLKTGSYQPEKRSINRVGLFGVDCSEAVDTLITALEDRFKEPLQRFSREVFERNDFARKVYDFIAMHYVRSRAFRRQIEHVVDTAHRDLGLAYPEAEVEYKRLIVHQDVEVFRGFVDRVASALTHFKVYPVVITNPSSFVTSDKIIYAGILESEKRQTVVWFPLSPTTGLFLDSEVHVGQILGPRVLVDRRLGRIYFEPKPEARLLRCQEPSPQEVSLDFIDTLNGLMVQGSKELYGAKRCHIDSALHNAQLPTGYEYHPDLQGEIHRVCQVR